MKEKYGGTEKILKEGTQAKERSHKVVNEDKSSSSKGLEKSNIVSKTKDKRNKKNRNGKVGINKHNNYAPYMYAPRKVCAKCGSVNHLSIDYNIVSSLTPSQPLMPNLATPALAALPVQFASMPFMNTFLAYNINFDMPWNINPNFSLYASNFQNTMISDSSKNEHVNAPLTQRQTPKVEVGFVSTKILLVRKMH